MGGATEFGPVLWANPCPRPTRIGERREPVARRRKRVPPHRHPDTCPRRVLRRDTGLLGSDQWRVRGRQGPDRLRVGYGWACRVFVERRPTSGARLSQRDDQVIGECSRLARPLHSPQVMGTPGLISRCGLKTTATVGAAFRGFIPTPRANRIRLDRMGGRYRLARRSQLLIVRRAADSRACAQCPNIECVRAGDSCIRWRRDAAYTQLFRSSSCAIHESQTTTSSRVNCDLWRC